MCLIGTVFTTPGKSNTKSKSDQEFMIVAVFLITPKPFSTGMLKIDGLFPKIRKITS